MPIDIEALFTKAHELQQTGKLPKPIAWYEQLWSISPNHIEALHFLGLAHAQLDDMHNAAIYLNRALELQPKNAILHNNLANAYKKLNVIIG